METQVVQRRCQFPGCKVIFEASNLYCEIHQEVVNEPTEEIKRDLVIEWGYTDSWSICTSCGKEMYTRPNRVVRIRKRTLPTKGYCRSCYRKSMRER